MHKTVKQHTIFFHVNASDLANGIEWVLNYPEYDRLCENAREKVVENFDSKIVAQKYIQLYVEILGHTGSRA